MGDERMISKMLEFYANTMHAMRSRISQSVWVKMHTVCYHAAVAGAILRGFFSMSRGICRYEKKWRPFLVGPNVHFQMEKESSVVLTRRIGLPDEGSDLEIGLAEATTLGFRVHWKFMNPPAGKQTRIRLQEKSKLLLGPNVSIMPGAYLSVGPQSNLVFEEDVATGIDIYITTRCGLKIGKGSMLGHQVKLMDYDGHPILRMAEGQALEDEPYGGTKSPITIGRNVWIGFSSTILKGVNIGDGAIIGANSVVTKDIPPFTIAAGNPAKIVLEGIKWRRY